MPHVTKDCVRASLEPNAGSERNSRGSSRLALEAVGPCYRQLNGRYQMKDFAD